MRKSLRQRVALFLSFSMAFTSIDSSVLVSAADVTGIVSEETHDHAAEGTKADVNEQTSPAETAMSEPEEESKDTETLVQMDDSESEGEQIVGEETDEESENSSVDTAGPDQSAGGEESSSESAETVTITRITGTSEKEQFISELDGCGITFNTKLSVTYSDGVTENCETGNDEFTDRYGNTIPFYLKNEDTGETKQDTEVTPMSAGTWYMICEIDGKEFQTEVAYHVVNLEDVEIPVLKVGPVTIHSGELEKQWYQFVAPETGKYYFRTSTSFSVFQKTEAGIEEVGYSHGSFQTTAGVTYYLGFQGQAKNETTGFWGNDWTTELAQVHGEITSVTDIIPEKEVYLNGMDFHMIAGTQITIHYPDRESKTIKWPDAETYIDETGNAISIRLKRKDDSEIYSQEEILKEGDYAVAFLVDGKEIGASDYVYHLREAANVELPTLSLGENEITSIDSEHFHNWYRFTPAETGTYKIDKYNNLNIYTSDGEFRYTQNGTFSATGGNTYYIGFRGPYPSDGRDYTWRTEIRKIKTVKEIKVTPGKTEFYAGVFQNHIRLQKIEFSYSNDESQEFTEIGDWGNIDGNENGIGAYVEGADGQRYNSWEGLPLGEYTVHIQYQADIQIEDTYVIQVNEEEPTPFHGGAVRVTGMKPDKKYAVSLNEDKIAQWFSYTPEKEQTVQLQSYGYCAVYGELYDETGTKLADNENDTEESNFSIQMTLEAGKTYYLKTRLRSTGEAGNYQVCLTEHRNIKSLEVVEHNLKTVYRKGSDMPNPDILLKATCEDDSNDVFYKGEKYGSEISGEVIKETGDLVDTLEEGGAYIYQIRYGEGKTVKVGRFRVVSLAEYTEQVVTENQEQKMDVDETHAMRYQFTVADEWIYQLSANVPFENLKVYDTNENEIEISANDNPYTKYTALQAGTYYVVADLDSDVTSLMVSVKKAILPTSMAVIYDGGDLLSGLDTLNRQNLSIDVTYTDGSRRWIQYMEEDCYGNRFQYKIRDMQGNNWDMYQTCPIGTYTVIPEVSRAGMDSWNENSLSSKILKKVMKEDSITSATVKVVKPDVAAMTEITTDQNVEVTGRSGRYFYSFIPKEAGTYTVKYQGTDYANITFYENLDNQLSNLGNIIDAEAGTRYMVMAEHDADYQFRIIKANTATEETVKKTIQSVEICSELDYVHGDSMWQYIGQLYLCVTYTDDTTGMVPLFCDSNGTVTDKSDNYGNGFYDIKVEKVESETNGEYDLNVSVRTEEKGVTEGRFPIRDVEDCATEVTVEKEVQASAPAYFKFVPEETGNYVFQTTAQEYGVHFGNFTDNANFSNGNSFDENGTCVNRATVKLQRGRTYYFNVVENRGNSAIPYTLSVSKIKKNVAGLKIVEIPEDLAAYAGIGLLDYRWLETEVTYSDGSTELLMDEEKERYSGMFLQREGSWINKDTFRVEVKCNQYRAFVDLPVKAWDYTGILELEKAVVIKAGENFGMYSFTPSEKGSYQLCITGTEQNMFAEVYDSETQRALFPQYGYYTLEADKTYNVAFHNYEEKEDHTVTVQKAEDPGEHVHNYVVDRKEATCEEKGYTQKRCNVCGELLEGSYEEIPALGHKLTETKAKEATCIEDGTKGYWICEVCGKVFADADGTVETTVEACVLPSLGHDFREMEWIEEKEPTCTEAGNWSYWYCPLCKGAYDLMETTFIPTTMDMKIREPLGHDWETVVLQAATDTEDGMQAEICSRCKEEKEGSRKPIPMTGHKMGEWSVTAEATCTEAGEKSRSCINEYCVYCKDGTRYTETEELPVLGHDMTETEGYGATCTEPGLDPYWTCSRCGKSYADAAGSTETTAKNQVTAALGHDMTKIEEVAPTCTENGHNAYWTCNRCGKIFSDEAGNTETTAEDQILPAIGHQWEEKVLEEPTEDKEGTTATICANCGEVQENSTKILPRKGHTYTIVPEAVTWTEAVAKAQESGGHLATITTAAESTYIRQLMEEAAVTDCWIGGFRDGSQWKWITREEFSYSGFSGVPNGEGIYLLEHADGLWSNSGNEEKHSFVIEQDDIRYILDSVAPEIERVSPENHSVLNGVKEFAVAASDDTAVKSIKMEWAVSADELEWKTLDQVIAGSEGIFSVDTTIWKEAVIKVRFLAEDIYGNSAYSTAVYEYTIDNQGPEKVTGLAYSATSTNITLSWADVADEDFGYFQVEQQQEDGSWTAIQRADSTLGVNISGLSPETKATYRVVAYDVYGNRGTESDPIEASTTKDMTAPVISAISPEAMRCKGTISMQFTVSDDTGVDALLIQTSRDKSAWTELASLEVQKSGTTIVVSYTLDTDTLEEGSVFVRAIPTDLYGNEGNSTQTAPFVEYVIDRTAPAAPQGLKAAEPKGKKVMLSWKRGEEEDLAGYQVVRTSLDTGKEEILVSDYTALSYVDRNVEFSQRYTYRIRVADLAGNISEDSEPLEVTIPADNEKPVIHSIAPASGRIGIRSQIRALVEDNNEVEVLRASYSTDGANWKTISDISVNAQNGVYPINVDWNKINLGAEKQFYLKAVCVDVSGNISEEVTRTYIIDDEAPEASNLTAAVKEDQSAIELTWTSGQEEDLAGFYLYRRAAGETKDNSICVLQKSAEDKAQYTFEDTTVQSLTGYIYFVRSIDKYGNSADSNEVMITAPLIQVVDTTDPYAYISANSRGELGVEMTFSAASSYDDTGIVSCKWDFGDGSTADTMDAVHTYEAAGTFEVTLTVADAAENTATVQMNVTIYDKDSTGFVRVRVHDENGAAVPDAGVYFDLGSEQMRMINTNGDGYAELTATKGMYPIGAYKDGYLPVKKEVQITEKQTTEVSLTLVKKDMIVGELTVKRMTLEEIKAAGIKLDEEANQNVFKFKTTLYYKGEEIPVEGTYSGGQWHWEDEEYKVDDRIIKPVPIPIPDFDGYWNYSGGGSGGSGGDGSQMTIKEPMIAVLEIPGEGSWLKDFFDVELTVLNQADSAFYVDNCKATLKVPSGLTLMDSNYTTASPEVSMGTIQGGNSASAHWILRGDEAGEYEVGADFSGTLRDFGASIHASFKVKEPFKVRGGENIWVDIITESAILNYTDGAIRVGIRNEDENPVYCPNLKLDKVHLVKSWKASGLSTVNTSREVLETGEELWYDYIIDRDDWEELIGAEDTTFYLVNQITEQLSGVDVNFTMKTVEPLTISPDKIEVYEYDSETGKVGEEVKLLDLQKNGVFKAEMPDLMIKTYRQDEYGKDIPTSMEVTIRDGYLMRDDKPGNSHVKKVTTDENGTCIVKGYEITDWLPGISDGAADGNAKTNYKAYDIGFYSSRARKIVSVVVRGKTATTGNLTVCVQVEKEDGGYANISGATVTVGNTSAVTGKEGKVDIFGKAVPTGKNTIRITAEGYYPLEDIVTVGEQTEKTYYLYKDDGLGHSFIKNLSCSLSSNSLGNITIIPKGTASGKVTFTLDKEIVDGEEFQNYTYRISNKDKVVKEGEFTSNTFLLDMNDMDAGEKLYFGMKVKTGDDQIYHVPYKDAHFLVIERPNFLNSFTYDLNQATDGKEWSLKGSDVVKVLFSKEGKDTKVNIGSGTKDSSDDEKEDTLLKLLHQYDFEVENKKEFPVTASYDTSGKVTIAYALKQGKAKKQSGFYAISNDKDGKPERTSLSGDIKIQLTFTYNTIKNVWDVAVDIILEGNVSVPLAKGEWKLAYAEVGFEGNGELDLQLCKTEVGDQFLEELSDSFALKSGTIEGKVKGSAGGMVGMKELASLGAYFKVGLKMGFMPYMKMLSTVEVGWESHLLCFQNGGAWLNENYELFADSGTTSHELSDQEYNVLSDEAAILAVAEAAQENAGGYVLDSAPANSQWIGKTEETEGKPGTLAQGVYYDVQPQVVSLADGTSLMVFVNYTEDKNNPVGMYYTRKVNGSWTEPKRISTDGTIEMSPKLMKTENGASLIWTKLKERLGDMSGTYTEEQIANALYDKMTVCQAYYDPETDAWTTQEIASNGKLVSKPVWAGNTESSLSIWVENEAGAETATAEKPDTLHFVYKKGESVAGKGEISVPGYLISDLSLEESDGTYLLTADIRNQMGEKEIFYSAYDGNNWKKAETISSSDTVYDPKYIKGKLYYISDRKILCSANGKIRQIVCSDSLEDVEAFTATAYGEKGIILAWSESKYDGSIYMAVSQDGVRWTEPFAAIEQAGLCAAPQIAVENGMILLIYQQAITENGVRYELKSQSIPFGTDLKLMESSTDGVLYAGAEMRTDFKAASVGTGNITGVKAVISEKKDGSAPIAEATVKNGLNGTIIWKVPEAYNGTTYYLVVLPTDSALEDVNMEDNAADIGGQMRDVAITYGSYMGTTAEGAKLLIGLENRGIVSSGGMSLKAENLESKELLYEGTLPDLAGGDERDVSFLVDKNLSDVSILVTLTCDAEETDEQNNTEVIRINDIVDLDETIQAHTHTWDDGEVVTEPTCTTTGEKLYHCTVEGCTEIRSEVLPASHKLNKIDAKSATCTETGNQEYWICERCKLVFADADAQKETTLKQRMIPATGHKFGNWEKVTAATCEKPGSMKRSCQNEGCDITETAEIPSLGHNYVTERKEATCEDPGYEQERCSNCNEIRTGSYKSIPALEHDYGEWVTVKQATCTTSGEMTQTCKRCGYVFLSIVNMTGHQYEEDSKEATCTEDGYTQQKCKRCGAVEDYEVIEALGHDLCEKIYTQEADCTTNGRYTQICNRCKETISGQKPMLGHEYKPDRKEATCTENGYTQQKCIRCDAVKDYTLIAAAGHAFGEWNTITPSTCKEKGMAERACSNDGCSEKETKELDLADHSWESQIIKAATATEEGVQALICKVCGEEKKNSRTAIPMTAHQMGEWKTVAEATCTEEGLQQRTCTYQNCTICKDGNRYTETKVMPALGHDLTNVEWTVDEPASCTREGSRSKHCTRCKEKALTEVIPMTAHAYVEQKKAPTCTTAGYSQLICTICHQVKADSFTSIPATGHIFGLDDGYWDYIVEPTCVDQGLIRYNCQNAGCQAKRLSVWPTVSHTWNSEPTVEKEATCEAEGMQDVRCQNCSAVKPGSTQTIARTDHVWKATKTIDQEATCTIDGQKSTHCSACGAIKENSVESIPATGHSYGEVTVIREASCTENGIQERRCEKCGTVETTEIEKTGHRMELTVTQAATCEEDGLLTYECRYCGRKQYKVQSALEHDWSEDTITIDSSLDENGEEFRTCYRCGTTDVIRIIPSKRQAGYLESINRFGEYGPEYGPSEADFQNVLGAMEKVDEELVTSEQIAGVEGNMSITVDAPQITGNMSGDATVVGGALALVSVTETQTEEKMQPTLMMDQTADMNSLADRVEEDTKSAKNEISINAGEIESEEIAGTVKKYQDLSIALKVLQPNGELKEYTSVESPVVFTLKLADLFTQTDYKLVRVSETARATEEVAFKRNVDGAITFTTRNFTGLRIVQGDCIDGKHDIQGAKENTISATCTEPGKVTVNCTVCGKEVQVRTLASLGHDYTVKGRTTPATCTANGSQIYSCSHNGCTETRQETIPATGHKYKWVAVPGETATCKKAGKEQQVCEICKVVGESRTVEALEHEYGEWTVTTPATCKEDGVETRSCKHTGCGEKETRKIPKTNEHIFVKDGSVEPESVNCFQVEQQKCSVCGITKKVTTGEPTHDWGEEQTKAATCMEKGMVFKICKNCEETQVVKVLDIAEHRLAKTEARKATCLENGNQVYWTCEACGKVFADESAQTETTLEKQVIPAIGHTLTATQAKAASCTTAGNHAYWTCTTCHQIFADAAATQPTTPEAMNIPAAGHQLNQTPAKVATCVAEGTRGYWTCGTCGMVFADQGGNIETTVANQVLGKVAHRMGGYVETVHPTALAAGVKTRTCSVCGYTEKAEVAKLISNVKLTTSKLPLQIKQKVALSKIVTDMAQGDYIASATSANKKIATVDNKGNVKGVKAGKVKITLNFASGTSRTVTITVQKKKVATSKITVSERNVTLKVKGKRTLMALISPITSKDKVTYKTSNKKIATVSRKGVITAKKAGKAVITVKAGKKTVKVKVKVMK